MSKKHLLPLAFFIFFSLVQGILLLPAMELGPLGAHAWRQTVGHAMVRNYVEEDDRFFHPRNDIRPNQSDTGEIYHEFPLLYWIAAKSSQETGWSPDFCARLWQYLFVTWIGITGYIFALGLGYSRVRSFFFGFFMTTAPVCFYYMVTVVPNFPGQLLFLAGTAALLHGTALFTTKCHRQIHVHLKKVLVALGFVLITLGTLIKPTYLFFGLPLSVICISVLHRSFQKKDFKAFWGWAATFLLGAGFVLGTNAIILNYAKKLYDKAPVEQQVNTPAGPAAGPISWQEVIQNIEPAAGKWFMEMYVNLAALPFFLLGLWIFSQQARNKRKNSQWDHLEFIDSGTKHRNYFWGAWLVSFFIFASLFVTRLADHDYYICSLLPVAALVSSRGAEALFCGKIQLFNRVLSASQCRRAALFIAFATACMMYIRVYKRWERSEIPGELRDHSRELSEAIGKNKKIVVFGDPTPIVFLYYLRQKGLALDATVTRDRMHSLIQEGIEFAVVYKKKAPLWLTDWFPVQIGTYGEFEIFSTSAN